MSQEVSNPINEFFLKHDSEKREYLLALRAILKNYNDAVVEKWKYSMPFYYFHEKRFCYIWFNKKTKSPYLGFTEGFRMKHLALEKGDRTRIKILPLNMQEDIPVDLIYALCDESMTVIKGTT